MAGDFSRSFYESKQWKNTRRAYCESVHWLCERCWADNVIKEGYILHHITHLTPNNINDSDITLGWDNLEFLCQTCHNQEHFKKYDETRDDVMFDKNGDLIPRGDT